MTKHSLALLCAVTFPLAAAFAQSPTPVPNKAPSAGGPEGRGVHQADENYALVLAPAGKDGKA